LLENQRPRTYHTDDARIGDCRGGPTRTVKYGPQRSPGMCLPCPNTPTSHLHENHEIRSVSSYLGISIQTAAMTSASPSASLLSAVADDVLETLTLLVLWRRRGETDPRTSSTDCLTRCAPEVAASWLHERRALSSTLCPVVAKETRGVGTPLVAVLCSALLSASGRRPQYSLDPPLRTQEFHVCPHR
jgi:hypothetical protein